MTDRPIIVSDSSSPRTPGFERSPRASKSRNGGASNIALMLLAIVTVGGFATLGWSFYSTQSNFVALTEELAQRIATLEEGVSSQQESALKADASIEEKLDFWESEIRKLWDLSNKANKPAIAANTDQIVTLYKVIEQLEPKVGPLETQTNDNTNTIVQTTRGLQDLVDEFNLIKQQNTSFRDQIEVRVEENEEAVVAHDEYRLENNTKIRDLQKRVGELERKL